MDTLPKTLRHTRYRFTIIGAFSFCDTLETSTTNPIGKYKANQIVLSFSWPHASVHKTTPSGLDMTFLCLAHLGTKELDLNLCRLVELHRVLLGLYHKRCPSWMRQRSPEDAKGQQKRLQTWIISTHFSSNLNTPNGKDGVGFCCLRIYCTMNSHHQMLRLIVDPIQP